MNPTQLLVGAAAGSALMFMLDPDRGRRRRALARDQVVRATRKTRDELDATAHDIAHRTAGMAATARRAWSAEPVSDRKLVQRVRTAIGRVCAHPHAIGVDAADGLVALCGPVLASEVDGILGAAAAVPGVRSVDNCMEEHETADGIPSLQGDGRLAEPSLDILQSNWAPATRAAVGAGLLATAVWMAMGAARASHAPDHQSAPM